MNVLARNNVKVSGTGTPMLFAHGYGCDQNMWRHITPHFQDRYRVVLFDHAGMGQADPAAYDRERHASLGGYVDDMVEICEALDLRETIFVGHSVGAMIGALASIKAPERFAKLVLIGISPRYIDDIDYLGGFQREALEGLLRALDEDYVNTSSQQLAPLVMGNPERPELTSELAASFRRTNAETARSFARVTFFSDSRADLPKVTTPAMIVQCAFDAIAPLAVGKYVHQHIKDSRLLVMRATGHCPNLSAPDETIAAIRAFL
jgi:sigma-B regulation protein RsbQ